MTIQDIIDKVPELFLEERKQLMHVLIDSLSQTDSPGQHSLSELRGLGAEIWKGIDVEEYIKELRNEWDHRP